MSDRELLKRHAALVDQMADRLGVDLQEAAIAGAVAMDEISDAVLRCTKCANPVHCESLLAQPVNIDHSPEYCRNRDLLRRLRP
ncbi:DUF6455 family protein [Ruegeria arenilitoris]|uniref:DUF6455 family protein n=1 Tax=Ruegeria arenilitoris TaxID=1173585 RepID=UPI00147BDD04|nr:DUF6455 family protein [Ruegeria arenilitoris]